MLLDLARHNLWVTLALWIVLYISDYALTLYGARLRSAQGAQAISTQGSYELNSYFVQDIDKGRLVSIRFLVALAFTTALLALLWLLAQRAFRGQLLLEFGIGAMVLLELTIHMRHLRNILSFRRQTVPGEMQGAIHYSRRFIYWTSALDLALFALLYLVLYLFVGEVWFLGGVASCGALALRHRLRVRREPLLKPELEQIPNQIH